MYISDLHVHSKYSYATSRESDLTNMDYAARMKGIDLIGTGDFTHPIWRKEMKEMLTRDENGLYRLKSEFCAAHAEIPLEQTPRFVVTGEISTVYRKNGKARRVHHLFVLPDIETAEDISCRLAEIGNVESDGRPILGMDSRDLLELALTICPEAICIPAHIWTPHFSMLGAFTGFERVEDCYGDLAHEIHALETGLSSDPDMNRKISFLDAYQLVSNSDAHSPGKLGREATILTCALEYQRIRYALCTGDGLYGTIEFFPEEGKYYLDGHRKCGICMNPSDSKKLGGICPVCEKPLTKGVLGRIEAFADRACPIRDKPYESLIPLNELISDCLGVSSSSKRVRKVYEQILTALGNEIHVLREAKISDIEHFAGENIAQAVEKMRRGQILKTPGYDGVYGEISVSCRENT